MTQQTDLPAQTKPQPPAAVDRGLRLLVACFLGGIAVGLLFMSAVMLTRARISIYINLEVDGILLVLLAWTKYARDGKRTGGRHDDH